MQTQSCDWVSGRVSAFVGLLFVALPVTAVAELPNFQVIDLGTLGGRSSSASALNESGTVVGSATTTTGNDRAFLYQDGLMMDLGTLGGPSSYALDINDNGQVTGNADVAVPSEGGCSFDCPHAFRFSEGEMVDLTPGWQEYSWSKGINASGQVALGRVTSEDDGFACLSSNGLPVTASDCFAFSENMFVKGLNDAGNVIAFRQDWTSCAEFGSLSICGPIAFIFRDGATTDLDSLGGVGSVPLAVNAAGQVTGWSDTKLPDEQGQGTEPHAFLYADGITLDLGTLGGSTSEGLALNAAGEVTGAADTDSGHRHAFLFRNGRMIDLGTLGGSTSTGVAINDSGVVAGNSTTAAGSNRAFVYNNGALVDVGTLGGSNSTVVDINSVGQVVGFSDNANGESHAFLATPISLLFSRLLDDVTGVGPGKSLLRSVTNAAVYYEADDLEETCSALDHFLSLVDRFTGMNKPKIMAVQAEGFIEDGKDIKDALGCP